MSDIAQDEFNRLVYNKEKISSHPEDRNLSDREDSEPQRESDKQEFDSSDEDCYSPNMASSTYSIPTNRYFNANTGPKGVIADASHYERARKKSFRQTLRDLAPFSNSTSPTHRSNHVRNKSSLNPDSDDSDSDFMRVWREQRMKELKDMEQKKELAMTGRRVCPSKRKYGSLDIVDAAGYLDAVEKVAKETVVVVLIHDESDASFQLAETLNDLASTYETTHFVRLHYEEAEMGLAGVPGVLAYRGGEAFANLVPFGESMKSNKKEGWLGNIEAVEECLQRNGILDQLY